MRPTPLVLLAAVLLLCGCGARLERLPPPGLAEAERVLVFADGMHSGVVLAATPALAALDAQPAGAPAGMPYLEVGFAADAWIAADNPGMCMKLAMATTTQRGVLYLVHLPASDRPRREAETPIRTWVLPLSAEGRRRLGERIDSWVDTSAPVVLRLPARTSFMRFATRDWKLSHNCHDFTVDLLHAAGIPVAQPPLMLAAPLRAALDRAWAARDLPP